jgi:hypothetical protein
MEGGVRAKIVARFLHRSSALCQPANVTAPADHLVSVFYLLVETDDYSALCSLLSAVPMKQEFDIKPMNLSRL